MNFTPKPTGAPNKAPINALRKTSMVCQVPADEVVGTVNHATTNAAVSMP